MRGARLGIIFVVLLALVWAVVLLPSLFRNKLQSSPSTGVRSFERDMGVLGGTRRQKGGPPGRWIMVPRPDEAPARRRNRVIRRRRRNFERLLALAGLTLALGFVPSLRWMWFVHLAIDGSIGLYILRLLQYKREDAERAAEPLPTTTAGTLPMFDEPRPAPATVEPVPSAAETAPEPTVVAVEPEMAEEPEEETEAEPELAQRRSG